MPKRKQPTVMTMERRTIASDDMVGSMCAWDGCETVFDGLMPPDWRWMLVYWHPNPAPNDSLGNIAMSEFCDRDAALCGEHAKELDSLLKDIGRALSGPVAGEA